MNGAMPRTSNVFPEISSTDTRSAWPRCVSVALTAKRATRPANTSFRSRKSTYIGYEKVRSLTVRPLNVPGPSSWTSSRGFLTGSSRSSTWSISEKIAVLAPMPRPSVRMTMAVNPGVRVSVRSA